MIARRLGLLLGALLVACSGGKSGSGSGARRTLDEAVSSPPGGPQRTFDLNREGKTDLWKFYVPGKPNEAPPEKDKDKPAADAKPDPDQPEKAAEPAKYEPQGGEVTLRLVRKD